jgi:two-component system sensor kinase FixL
MTPEFQDFASTAMSTTPLESVLQGELALRIFDESNDAFIVFDPHASVVAEVNATAQRLTGQRRRQLIGLSLPEVVVADQDDGLSTLLKETSETGFYQVRDGYYLKGADDRLVPVSLTVSRLHVHPRPLALIIAHDMTKRSRLQTELRELERQLEQNRRLASLGELVATLAHEIRQPLHAIANVASVAGTLLERGDSARAAELLQRISDEGLRGSEVVTQIQSFVRAQPPETVNVDVNLLIRETLAYLQPETSHDAIRIDADLTPGAAVGVCNPIQLQEVVINLVRNSLEACGRAGIVEPHLRITTDLTPAYVRITMSDNGPGIAPGIRGRLFQPFTTTRDDGMGMGLAICRRMMTAICGRLELDESTGEGATFVVSIPRAGVPQNDSSF